MMMRITSTFVRLSFVFALLAEGGCTFYTACPAGNNNGNGTTAGAGGGGGSGDSGGSATDAGPSNSTSGTAAGGAGPRDPLLPDEPPPGEWTDVAPDLGADAKDTCGPFFNLAVYPDRDELLVGAYYGLWSTRDGGESWRELGTGEGSDSTNNRLSQIIFDPDAPDAFWEVGIYGPAFFRTEDAGETFTRLGDLTHIDSIGIDLGDPKRRTMLASPHEQPSLLKSDDGGQTWTDIYSNLPADTKHCSYSLVQDADTYLMSCGGGSDPGRTKIIRTTDGGDSWDEVNDGGGGTPPLVHSDGTIYWSEETGALSRSEDGGETWERVTATGLLLPLQPVELPDGRIASATNQFIVVSDDGGETWKKASAALPFNIPTGFVYSSFQRAFFISRFGCFAAPTGPQGNELTRFDFDYEKY